MVVKTQSDNMNASIISSGVHGSDKQEIRMSGIKDLLESEYYVLDFKRVK